MKKLKLLKSLTKVTALTAAGGYVGGRISSTPTEAPTNAIRGAQAAGLVGLAAASSIPIARNKAVRKAARAAGKYIFRRVRGRIIPIRKK